MDLLPGTRPEELALRQVVACGAVIVLLANLALLAVLLAGWVRGRSLLSRRWSAAHVLIVFQAWLLLTGVILLIVGVVMGIAAGVWGGFGGGEKLFADDRWTSAFLIAALVAQNVAMVAVVLYVVVRVYDQWPAAAGLSFRGWAPRATLGLLAAVVVIPINEVLEYLSRLALYHLPLPHATTFLTLVQKAVQKEYTQLLGMFSGTGGLAFAILLIGIIGPLGEEVLFRGFAYRCFRTRWGPMIGMVASAALFAIVHVHPLGLLPIFAVGCALAYLYERTGTLVAPFALHAVNNIAAVLLAHFGVGH